jgi:hypothetical protein
MVPFLSRVLLLRGGVIFAIWIRIQIGFMKQWKFELDLGIIPHFGVVFGLVINPFKLDQKVGSVSSMGTWFDNDWRWVLSWRRDFFQWEIPIYEEFLALIQQFVPSVEDDRWLWRDSREEGFSVKSCYLLLVRNFREHNIMDPTSVFVFSKIWKCGAPSKACAFVWQMLLDRIQSKENLWRRRIIQQQATSCVFCDSAVESTIHLFLHCPVSSKVWYEIMRWLGVNVIVPHNLVSAFATLVSYGRGKRNTDCLALIWVSFMWSIWRFRNNVVFNNKVLIIEELVDYIKFQAWKWFVGRVAKSPCLLYEWQWSPSDCFSR